MNTPDLHLYNLETEAALVGSCLIDPEAIFYVTNVLAPSDFFEPKYRVTYEAMQTIAERGDVIDVVTVTTELERMGTLVKVGGIDYADIFPPGVIQNPPGFHLVHLPGCVRNAVGQTELHRTQSD